MNRADADHIADHHHHHHSHAGCHHGTLGEHHGRADAICIDHLSFRYGSVQALRDVTLHVENGCILGIIGPNGGGKTTLLKILLGLLEGYQGSVEIMGHHPRDVCRHGQLVGYVPQRHEYERRFPANVRQVVRVGLAGRAGLLRRYRKDDLARVEHLMHQVGVSELADRPIGNLSGGQQQRVFIARALAAGPSILLLDEPTIGIDVSGQQRFAELIRKLHEEHGLTVVIVSHDLRAVAASCE
ncbi:MAG: ABC transporter ATP-binding protein, partial [Phycisphaeraceae bacterium]